MMKPFFFCNLTAIKVFYFLPHPNQPLFFSGSSGLLAAPPRRAPPAAPPAYASSIRSPPPPPPPPAEGEGEGEGAARGSKPAGSSGGPPPAPPKFMKFWNCGGMGGARPGSFGLGSLGSSPRAAASYCSGVATGGAKALVNMIPAPSIMASINAPAKAFFAAVLGPARAARTPPVSPPEMIEFHGSSFCLIATREQSKTANIPPHIAKFPPRTGERALTACKAPSIRWPLGAFRAPLKTFQAPPPMAPIQNAAPTSSKIL
mmetsp:Transcript_15774/g.25704  ORF Transcript_15774/g.25704 Transcript_15774/m.25704 type:complete len:260 (-) Transcript_15774:90-869(-)